MKSTTNVQEHIFTCLACKQDVYAQVALDIKLGAPVLAGNTAEVPAVTTVTGLRINHDCMPKATR